MSNFILLMTFYACAVMYAPWAVSDENVNESHLADIEKGRILIIHSYGVDSGWSQSIQNGIVEANNKLTEPFDIYVEYLDGNRLGSKRHFYQFITYLEQKYSDIQIDAVALVDDYAANLVEYLEGMGPMFLVGVSQNTEWNHLDMDLDIVYDDYEVFRMIHEIVQIRPDLKTIHFVVDASIVGANLYDLVNEYIERYYHNIDLKLYREQSLEEVLAALKENVSPEDAVLLGPYNPEVDSGTFHSVRKLTSLIGVNSPAPVFTFWENYISSGIVGGYVIKGDFQGAYLIKRLTKRFDKNYRDGEIFTLPKNKLIFNYTALVQHGIYLDQLPSDSVIIGRPLFSFRDDMVQFFFAIGFLLVVAVVANLLIKEHARARNSRELSKVREEAFYSQRDMICAMGEVIEFRSGETGGHVRRVAQISSHLGKLYGLSHYECEILKIISPMHDVGKITTPESILNKPGKLTPEEFELMKEHTTEGYKLLSSSSVHLMKMAAIVAYEHHEKWDGSGYPNGKRGEEIHIYGRIAAVADVFDALLSDRAYKKAWPEYKILDLFHSESGKHFEPKLVDILLDNFSELIEVRNQAETFVDSLEEELVNKELMNYDLS